MTSNDLHVQSTPLGLKWRSSYVFTTVVVSIGVATDLLIYTIIVPVVPFQLEALGYDSISARAGWLLFAYSGGLVLSTIPTAMFTERYNMRQLPLIFGLVVLIGSQILFMEAPNYAVMCVARALQGIGSTMVWVVGLALLCDCTPEQHIAKQLGFTMASVSVGMLAGPPIGGALYKRWGWRAPFIFGVIICVVDFIGRLLIIERKDALKYGHDPAAIPEPASAAPATDEEKSNDAGTTTAESTVVATPSPSTKTRLSLTGVLVRLSKSPRAVSALITTLLYGLIYTAQEPTLPLHLQSVWGLDSEKVGLIYLASVIPTLFSGPISGYYCDRVGPEYIACVCFILGIPWWAVLMVKRSLALFIAAFALASFFVSGIIPPIMAELATVARQDDGIGYGHVYGAFNLAYGIGTTVGPIIGGQIYNVHADGWAIIAGLSAGIVFMSFVLTFFYTGDRPLGGRLLAKLHNK
ncbi:MFS domain-containing protein [Mycena kentingensis (nom. inval.)]|nr:MFS domain-containing protein [Mycena kentingensis (nom. inval.)]